MDKSNEFIKFRETYSEFYYNGFSLTEDDEAIYMEFDFEIPEDDMEDIVTVGDAVEYAKSHCN